MTSTKTLLDRFPATVLGAHVAAGLTARPTTRSDGERLARIELELEARAFLSKYAYFFDAKDLEGLMTLYADDCELVNTAGTYTGARSIRDMQAADMPKTEISFHHFSNVVVAIDSLENREVYVTAYMYNVAIREEEPYGTIGTVVFCLRGVSDGGLKATAIRIAIDSRHSFNPKFVPSADPGPYASSSINAYDLVGRKPRFPTKKQTA